MRYKFLLFLACLFIIIGVNAWGSNTFSNLLTIENLTLTGTQNISRNLTIPVNTILTKGYLNLSGYRNETNYTETCPYFSGNVDCSSSVSPYTRTGCTTGTLGEGECTSGFANNRMYDEDLDTYGRVYFNSGPPVWKTFLRVNYTARDEGIYNITTKFGYDTCETGLCEAGYRLSCYNLTDESYSIIYQDTVEDTIHVNRTISIEIPEDCLGDKILFIHSVIIAGNTTDNSYLNFFGTKMEHLAYGNFTNVSLSIEDNNVWNYTGQFNQTNNRTDNLALIINRYLNATYLVGANYVIPFIFHSDTAGILQYSDMKFDNEGFLENSITYNELTVSGAYETFTLNMTYDSSYFTGISGYLTYNNTNYSASITGTGNNIIITSEIAIPTITAETNNTFYFDIGLTNATKTYYYHSTSYNQTVTTLAFDNCTLYNYSILNFSMFDEESLKPINGTLEYSLNVYSLETNNLVTSFNDTLYYITGQNTSICVNNLTKSYKLAYEIKYYGNSSYYQKYKIVQNMTLSNTTTLQNIPLYNLLSSSGNVFKVIVVGNLYTTGNSNLLIDAQKQYLALNGFLSVENSLSDSSGEGVLHLIPASEVYNFIISYQGVTLGTFNNYKVQCQNPTTLQCTITLNLAQATTSLPDFNNYGNVTVSYTLDETNNILYLTYSSTDGEVKVINQTLISNDGFGNTTICSTSSSGTSGTLICSITEIYQNTSFFSVITIDGTYAGTKFFSLGEDLTGLNIYGIDLYIEIVMFCCLVLLFIPHPIFLVIGAVLGMFMSILLVFITGASLGSMIGILMYYLASAVLIIWQIGRKM